MDRLFRSPQFQRLFYAISQVPLSNVANYISRMRYWGIIFRDMWKNGSIKWVLRLVVRVWTNRALNRAIPYVITAAPILIAFNSRRKIHRWLATAMSKIERNSVVLLEAFDVDDSCDAREYVGQQNGGNEAGVVRERTRPKPSLAIAMALARRAYLQFGPRARSEANELITRKFLRDVVLELKDLSIKDACAVVDVALSLSFLPSAARREMNQYDRTFAFEERRCEVPESSWVDWLLGRVRPEVSAQ
jgi:hypothetical protein